MAAKKKILHISQKVDEAFTKKGFMYRHFNYYPFFEDDDILGMWNRLVYLCSQYKPDLILVHFEHDDCMNDYEEAQLKKFGITLKVYG
jgi:DNA polymerase elongation subunit (family B)